MTTPRLQELYQNEIRPRLKETGGFGNIMQVPKITKITVNMGLGEGARDKNVIKAGVENLTLITGQKPLVTRARQSNATFGIRDGWPVGCKVTLRSERMYEFLDRLINVAIPRIRDFRGFSIKAFDGRGNYSLGIAEQIVFLEIDYDKIDRLRGLDVTLTTDTDDNKAAQALLEAFNFPFKETVKVQ